MMSQHRRQQCELSLFLGVLGAVGCQQEGESWLLLGLMTAASGAGIVHASPLSPSEGSLLASSQTGKMPHFGGKVA